MNSRPTDLEQLAGILREEGWSEERITQVLTAWSQLTSGEPDSAVVSLGMVLTTTLSVSASNAARTLAAASALQESNRTTLAELKQVLSPGNLDERIQRGVREGIARQAQAPATSHKNWFWPLLLLLVLGAFVLGVVFSESVRSSISFLP